MKITSIAPWFGGKRTLAPLIAEEMGPHTQYFEPFCGSMAVLLGKTVCEQETVNDLHGDVTNLAWVLADRSSAEDLYDRASRTLFAESLIRTYWKELGTTEVSETVDVDRAYKFFVFSWAMRNGVSGTRRVRGNGFQICNRFTAGGGSPTIRFRSAIESIPDWHDRLRNVVILRRDGLSLIKRFSDTPNLVIYADPPYVSESRSGWHSSGAHSRYEHEFEHDNPMFGDDHTTLRDSLAGFKEARVIVSYYDCPRIRSLYRDWNILAIPGRKNLAQANGKGSRKTDSTELLIINGPSLTGR